MSATRVPAGCPRCRTVEHHLVDVTQSHGHVARCDHCALVWVPGLIDMRDPDHRLWAVDR